jgi:uridine kinase
MMDLDGTQVQNWDCPEAMDMEAFYLELQRLKQSCQRVILDGFLIYVDPRILALIDIKITLSADFDTLRSRRNSRKGYITKSGILL